MTTSPVPAYQAFYPPIAVLGLTLSGVRLYNNVDNDEYTITYYSIWELVGTPRGASIGLISLIILGSFVAISAYMYLRPPTSPVLPIIASTLAALAALMLTFKAGASNLVPATLSDGGRMMFVLTWASCVFTAVHAAHILFAKRRYWPEAPVSN
ncbi:hypothetical protein BAY61_00050 [Prauserella marina]|uniref:Uncharacterized protein n=1 Tax=Prauserella marina TaxID=530584 RepID=A0A222VIA0_9PSEU|nr:hypothetical protein [Prauserella marina]ASR33645.1 hypothetical protein BAY61_00050 [Prauserella marina]PWV82185.1 hypothetical protein DES30_102422 [Prauserella marina]SDD21155.1 hypothetical protein SAMN05421630_106422 [Prauserella marina]